MNMIVGIVRSCSFFTLAILRSVSQGYTVPYVAFAVISIVGALLIAAVKVKGAVGQSLEKQAE